MGGRTNSGMELFRIILGSVRKKWTDVRFIVTDVPGCAIPLYEKVYCARNRIADAAYDSDGLRDALTARGAWANIMPMPQRRMRPAFSTLYQGALIVTHGPSFETLAALAPQDEVLPYKSMGYLNPEERPFGRVSKDGP